MANEKAEQRARKVLSARLHEPVQIGPLPLTAIPADATMEIVPGWVVLSLRGKRYLVPPARFAFVEVE